MELAGVFYIDLKVALRRDDENAVLFKCKLAERTGANYRVLLYKADLQNAAVFRRSSVDAKTLGIYMKTVVVGYQGVGECDLVKSQQFQLIIHDCRIDFNPLLSLGKV